MGTPDFAVEALRQLVEGGYNVVVDCFSNQAVKLL